MQVGLVRSRLSRCEPLPAIVVPNGAVALELRIPGEDACRFFSRDPGPDNSYTAAESWVAPTALEPTRESVPDRRLGELLVVTRFIEFPGQTTA